MRKKRKRILILSIVSLFVIVGVVGCFGIMMTVSEASKENAGRIEAWDDGDGTVMRNLRYGERTNNTYDLFIPKTKAKNGMLLFIHGGAYMGGDKQWLEYACRRYAKMGYPTSTMNYSFINSKTEYGSLETMDSEVMACVSHAAATLQAHGITVNNLAVGGHSAGGQIAATFALKHAEDSPIPVRFAIVQSAPVDLIKAFPVDEDKLARIRKELQNGVMDSKDKQDVDNLVKNASGVVMQSGMYDKTTVDSLIKRNSPVHLVNAESVPIIIAYGAKDFLANPAQYQALEQAYKHHSRPYTLIVYPNSGHELDGDPDKTRELQSTVKEYLLKYFKES